MPHLPDHVAHDPELIAAYAAGDATGPALDQAADLVAGCTECAELHRDLRAISTALPELPAPVRPRDFRLTPEQAASLRPAGWRGVLAAFAAPRFRLAAPLGAGLAAAGLAGILLASPGGLLPGCWHPAPHPPPSKPLRPRATSRRMRRHPTAATPAGRRWPRQRHRHRPPPPRPRRARRAGTARRSSRSPRPAARHPAPLPRQCRTRSSRRANRPPLPSASSRRRPRPDRLTRRGRATRRSEPRRSARRPSRRRPRRRHRVPRRPGWSPRACWCSSAWRWSSCAWRPAGSAEPAAVGRRRNREGPTVVWSARCPTCPTTSPTTRS